MARRSSNESQTQWASVPGFSAQEFSTTGEVRFTGTRVPCRVGLWMSGKGTRRRGVGLIPDAGGRVHQFVVARAMLLAFVGPPPSPDKKQACHRNDVPTDDRIENLYWGSASDNVLDAVRNGRLNGSRRVRPHEPSAQKAFQAREMNPELRERVDPLAAAAVRLREFLGGKGRMSIFIDTPEGEWKLLMEPTPVAPAPAPARTPQGAAAC